MIFLITLIAGLFAHSSGFTFVLDKLTGNTPRCLIEELADSIPVQADVTATVSQGGTLNLKVYSGDTVVTERRITPKLNPINFVTGSGGGNVKFCFSLTTTAWMAPVATIKFEMRTGSDAVEFAHAADLERMKPMESALRMAEDDLEHVHHELMYLKKREKELRGVYERFSHKVVAYEALLGLVIIIVLVLGSMRSSTVIRKMILG